MSCLQLSGSNTADQSKVSVGTCRPHKGINWPTHDCVYNKVNNVTQYTELLMHTSASVYTDLK